MIVPQWLEGYCYCYCISEQNVGKQSERPIYSRIKHTPRQLHTSRLASTINTCGHSSPTCDHRIGAEGCCLSLVLMKKDVALPLVIIGSGPIKQCLRHQAGKIAVFYVIPVPVAPQPLGIAITPK